ncbi:DUF1648 domain-containing protein [Pseudonocardia hispaniensis]|uniref:DUF1648 domain-containing protein n=1 Tax=Pseudonocardia hispaniensis TaxID=904933 RepID=A0ABW1IYN3_9PSEU
MRRAWLMLALSGLVYAATLVWAAAALPPGEIPVHFGADGRADRLGSRGELLGVFGGVGALVLALFGGTLAAGAHGRTEWLNIPHKDYWSAPENRARLRRLLAGDIAVLGGATMLLLTALVVITVRAIGTQPARLPPALWVVLGVYLALVVGATLLGRRRYRPPPQR